MVELSIPPSFESIDLLKHHHIPKKAAILDTIHYLQDHHLPVHKLDIYRYGATSMSLDELHLAGLQKMNLADFIIT